MNYKILILRRAQKELSQLSPEYYTQIKKAIIALSPNPRPPGCLKLTSRDAWRIKIGPYRVIFEIDDPNQRLIVLNIGHRRDVYR
jgi:mRNA interferase RelE/StbE